MSKKLGDYISVLRHLNWIQTLYLFFRCPKPRNCSIRVLNSSVISLDKTARIILEDGSFLEINRQSYPMYKGLKCRLSLSAFSTLHIRGSVSFHHETRVLIHPKATLTIGDHTYLNGASIDCSKCIVIGSNCAIGGGVKIMDNSWHFISNGHDTQSPINIGNHVWIATNAIILPGVSLGDGCVIASGAVVTHDIPSGALAAGVPARVIRDNVMW